MNEDDNSVAMPCVEYQGPRDADGYGIKWHDGRAWRMHRLAWTQASGAPIPPGFHVLHKCDNPPCINPQHLFIGTNADNMRDKAMKGRQARGKKINTAKLTEAQAAEIKERLACGETLASLSRAFGVDYSTIRSIRDGETWTWVKGASVGGEP